MSEQNQPIGDNSLIKSILSTRISETPTKKVDEVEIPADKKEKQRQISARWGIRLYDKLQTLGAMVVYDKLNGPKDYIEKRDELLEKVYDGKITEKEREKLNFFLRLLYQLQTA